ncbi:RNA polymerase sigma factor [Pseudarthrobacter sp. P1]|uniref:RNA polymerase sigma factor n=1 Tax=Pseudarthrobacter sp. P1 TaxID=3418418 RepID=UPI003CE7304A
MDPTIEDVYRRDWPLIVGAVARYTSNLALAEDSVQEAFARALAFKGPIYNPDAWITTTARRIAVDALRRTQVQTRLLPRLAHEAVERNAIEMVSEEAPFAGDERLLLISLAAQPQLREADRIAVALRFVCGESTADIARVLLIPEATLAARLTRAKKRIAATGLATSSPAGLLPRIDTILTTVYLLFTLGHGVAGPVESGRRASAMALGRDLARLLPSHLETQGLLALMLLTQARQGAAADDDGGPVGLEDADRTLWDRDLIAEGMALAAAALPGGGRFALQAGISGLHDAAVTWEATDWNAIARLYVRLYAVWPAPAVALNRAIARGLSPDVGPEAALAELDGAFPAPSGPLAGQVWAARAELLRRIDRTAEAADDYRKALASALPEGDKRFLQRRLSAIGG